MYSYYKNQIVGPIQEKERGRATGGRVVASLINHAPTHLQKEAGNYKKEHVHLWGLDITVENAKGSTRKGIGADGKEWKAKLPSHYGYLRREAKGADGDHLDVYLSPYIKSDKVFIINQVDPNTKQFDEHKIMLGAGSLQMAINTYEKAFSDGKGLERIGSIISTTIPKFKNWLKTANTKKKFAA